MGKKTDSGLDQGNCSSPSEMRERRLRSSVRREQYYGSVELVVSVDPRGRIRNIGRFRLEPSSDFHSVSGTFFWGRKRNSGHKSYCHLKLNNPGESTRGDEMVLEVFSRKRSVYH